MTEPPDPGGHEPPTHGQSSSTTELHANAWQETLEEMWAIEEELQEDGWDTIATAAGETGPVAPEHDKGYWGLTHIVPDSDAAAIADVVEAGAFSAYDVFRNAIEGRLFAVVVLYAPEADAAVLVTYQFPLRDAVALVEHTEEVGSVNTVIRYLDGTVVAQVGHEDPAKFFPEYEDFASFADDWTATPGIDDEDGDAG